MTTRAALPKNKYGISIRGNELSPLVEDGGVMVFDPQANLQDQGVVVLWLKGKDAPVFARIHETEMGFGWPKNTADVGYDPGLGHENAILQLKLETLQTKKIYFLDPERVEAIHAWVESVPAQAAA